MNLRQLLVCCILPCLPALAAAQETLGEVMDQGGQKLSKQDMTAQVVGSVLKWKSPNGMLDFQATPNEGGNVTGAVSTGRFNGSLSGTWELADDGRFCMSVKYNAGSMNGNFDRCAYWFKAGDGYWASGSPTERGAKVFKYAVSK